MNFEPKVTDQAAFVAIWHNGELLILQSRKWQTEGTPYLLPGGGCKKAGERRADAILLRDETPTECTLVELVEETGISLEMLDRFFGSHRTQWSDCSFFERTLERALPILLEKDKLFGYEWWNFEIDRKRIEALKPFMMPGLKWYLEQKGLL